MPRKNLDAYRAYQKQWKRENGNRYSEANRWRAIKKSYGITQADYLAMLESQNGICAICGSPPVSSTYCGMRKGTPFTATRTLLHVDHCHKTGKVRGLLCPNCNKGLGWYEKHPQEAQEYLL